MLVGTLIIIFSLVGLFSLFAYFEKVLILLAHLFAIVVDQ